MRAARCVGIIFPLLISLTCISASHGQPVSTNKWPLQIGQVDSSPAVGEDGTIYCGSFDQGLWAVDSNGIPVWTYRTHSEIKSSPAIGMDGTLYFGCRDQHLYAISSKGKRKWHFKTGGWVDSSPAIARDGTVCFGSWDKRFYGLNPDGSLKWVFETAGEIESSPVIGSDGTIYFGSHDRKFYALTPEGREKWHFTAGGPIISSPALNGEGAVYVTGVDGVLYALNDDGSLRWHLKTGGITESSPVVASDGTLYIAVNRELWAIGADGRKKWSRGVLEPVPSSPWLMGDDVVHVSSPFRFVDAFDAEGNQVWHFYADSSSAASPGISVEGRVYLPAKFRDFHVFQMGRALARSPWPKFRGNPRNTGNQGDTLN